MPVPGKASDPPFFLIALVNGSRAEIRPAAQGHGLFLTQVPTADFMAGRIMADGRKVRILDPAPAPDILAVRPWRHLYPDV